MVREKPAANHPICPTASPLLYPSNLTQLFLSNDPPRKKPKEFDQVQNTSGQGAGPGYVTSVLRYFRFHRTIYNYAISSTVFPLNYILLQLFRGDCNQYLLSGKTIKIKEGWLCIFLGAKRYQWLLLATLLVYTAGVLAAVSRPPKNPNPRKMAPEVAKYDKEPTISLYRKEKNTKEEMKLEEYL